MSFKLNASTEIVSNGTSIWYFFSPKHRGLPTTEISVWSINFDDEFACFNYTLAQQWHNGQYGWGFLPLDAFSFSILGRNLRNPNLTIAKFVADQQHWHGYPADIRHKPKDKPLPEILKKWHDEGYITKSYLVRIKQGQV